MFNIFEKKEIFQSDIKLIVGLGNFGFQYDLTRHNVGFLAVDSFCREARIKMNLNKFSGIFFKGRIQNQNFIVAKPQTYMNLSGIFIKDICDFYKIPLENILIIYDDKDIDMGKIKLSHQSSAGSHNGMKNVIEVLNTKNINRIRIGIAPGERSKDKIVLKNYVLQKFNINERTILVSDVFPKTTAIIYNFLFNDFLKLMQEYNQQNNEISKK